MRLKKLEIKNYRNLESLSLELKPGINFLVGDNAQGKTNLLESIYVLSWGKSYRTKINQQLIRFGCNASRLHARIVDCSTSGLRLNMLITEKGKSVSKNGVDYSRLSSYVGSLLVVLFVPEDLDLIKGPPSFRRRFLDFSIGQLSPKYVSALSELHDTVKRRNLVLKQHSNTASAKLLLEVLDAQLLKSANVIWKYRLEFISKLSKLANETYEVISFGQRVLAGQKKLDLEYSAETHMSQSFENWAGELSKLHSQEFRKGVTLFGPQRDDFRVLLGGLDLGKFGSQGEQRTAALALKIAELELINQEAGNYPLLLLDDVLSELDITRCNQLLKNISGKAQTFITTTSLKEIDGGVLDDSSVYSVSQGAVELK